MLNILHSLAKFYAVTKPTPSSILIQTLLTCHDEMDWATLIFFILLYFIPFTSSSITGLVSNLKFQVDSQSSATCLSITWVALRRRPILTKNYNSFQLHLGFRGNSISNLTLGPSLRLKFGEPCSIITYDHADILNPDFSENIPTSWNTNLLDNSYHIILLPSSQKEYFLSPTFSVPTHIRQFSRHIFIFRDLACYDFDSIWNLRRLVDRPFQDRVNFHLNPLIWAVMKTRRKTSTRRKSATRGRNSGVIYLALCFTN